MASTASDPRELLLHELGDLLYVERTSLKTLPKMAKLVQHERLSKRLERHVQETESQAKNLERAFEAMGEKPKAKKCPGIEGIRDEYQEMVGGSRSGSELLDIVSIGSAMRVEHYEIAAYTGALRLAEQLGEEKVTKLLERNLNQELKMLADAEKVAGRLPMPSSGANGAAAAGSNGRGR